MKAEQPPHRPDSRREGKTSRARRPPHPGEQETITARRVQALDLRKTGATYRQIAAQLGTSAHTAFDDVQAELRELRTQTVQEAEDLRDLELQRCDVMTEGVWTNVKAGDPRSVAAAVRVSERRARLLGLDAAMKTEHSGGIDVRLEAQQRREFEAICRILDEANLKVVQAKIAEVTGHVTRLKAEIDEICEPARKHYRLMRERGFYA
jgi:DNA-binding CsgD family transcriptional regulator